MVGTKFLGDDTANLLLQNLRLDLAQLLQQPTAPPCRIHFFNTGNKNHKGIARCVLPPVAGMDQRDMRTYTLRNTAVATAADARRVSFRASATLDAPGALVSMPCRLNRFRLHLGILDFNCCKKTIILYCFGSLQTQIRFKLVGDRNVKVTIEANRALLGISP
jgi:hypothetical protein